MGYERAILDVLMLTTMLLGVGALVYASVKAVGLGIASVAIPTKHRTEEQGAGWVRTVQWAGIGCVAVFAGSMVDSAVRQDMETAMTFAGVTVAALALVAWAPEVRRISVARR